MKFTFLSLLALAFSLNLPSAQALTAEQTLIGTRNAEDCLNSIESTLHTLTHPSEYTWIHPVLGLAAYAVAYQTARNVNENLDNYQNTLRAILKNLDAGQSNRPIYLVVTANLQRHEAEDYLGFGPARYDYGKKIVACIRPYLNFSGSAAQQRKTAQEALQFLPRIRKAVQ